MRARSATRRCSSRARPARARPGPGARLIAALLRGGPPGRHRGDRRTRRSTTCSTRSSSAAADEGSTFRGLKKAGGDNPESHYESAHIELHADQPALPAGRRACSWSAGPPWLWAREDMRAPVDVLFVDEAGQMSLADALAVAGAARSVVLLGDPQQLAHVSQGTHPRGSGCSVLEHLLGDRETIPPAERRVPRPHVAHAPGRLPLRLARRCTTAGWQLDRRAASASASTRRGLTPGAGLRLLEVEHADNRQTSTEEADADRRARSTRCSTAAGAPTRPATSAPLHARRHPGRRALQRPGALPARPAAARRARRHGRQVPGPGGAGRVLLDGDLERRGRPPRHGLPLQPQPAQRRGLARAGARRRRLLAAAAVGALQHASSRCGW